MKQLQVKQTKNQRIFYIIMAAVFFPQGMINLVEKEGTFYLVFGILQVAICLLYIPLAFGGTWSWNDPAVSPVLLLGPKTIGIKSWWFRNRSLAISEIETVLIKPEQVAFIPKNEGEVLYFTHMGPNSKEIILEVDKFCEQHDLPTEETGYR